MNSPNHFRMFDENAEYRSPPDLATLGRVPAVPIADIEANLTLEKDQQATVVAATVICAEGAPWSATVTAVAGGRRAGFLTELAVVPGDVMTLRVSADGVDHAFAGVVSEVVATPSYEGMQLEVQIVPAVKTLDGSPRWRRFLGRSVGDIVEELLAPVRSRFGSGWRSRDVDVEQLVPDTLQAGETDFQFLIRLLAERALRLAFPTGDDDSSRTAGIVVVSKGDFSECSQSVETPIIAMMQRKILCSKDSTHYGRDQNDEQGVAVKLHASAHALDAVPGARFEAEEQHWRVVRTRMNYSASAGGGGNGWVRLEAVPQDAPSVAPAPARPTVPTVFRAIVVGPTAGAPSVDSRGRVRVRFAWEEGEDFEGSETWLPLTQACAGSGWGLGGYPLVGDHVLVAFAAGDPDEPFVAARVHDPNQPLPEPPAGLGLDSVQRGELSGLLTKPLGPGGGDGHAILFSDRQGESRLAVYAAGEFFEKVDGRRESKVAGDDVASVAGAITRHSEESMELAAGRAAISMSADGRVQINADQLELTASSGAVVRLDETGVTINGTLVRIN